MVGKQPEKRCIRPLFPSVSLQLLDANTLEHPLCEPAFCIDSFAILGAHWHSNEQMAGIALRQSGERIDTVGSGRPCLSKWFGKLFHFDTLFVVPYQFLVFETA